MLGLTYRVIHCCMPGKLDFDIPIWVPNLLYPIQIKGQQAIECPSWLVNILLAYLSWSLPQASFPVLKFFMRRSGFSMRADIIIIKASLGFLHWNFRSSIHFRSSFPFRLLKFSRIRDKYLHPFPVESWEFKCILISSQGHDNAFHNQKIVFALSCFVIINSYRDATM